MLRRFVPLAPLLWAALFLLVLELALEVRAAKRGHRAELLGIKPGVEEPADVNAAFGPTAEFPFRGPVVPAAEARTAGALWIASSSYAEDVYIPAADIFPTRLGAALERPVLNASRGGLTILSNLEDLEAHGADFEPHFVLLYQMSNDLDQISNQLASAAPAAAPGGASTSESDEARLAAGDATEGEPEAHGQLGFAPVSPWIQRMTVYRHLKGHVSSRLAQHLALWDALPDPARGEALFLARVERFVAEVRARGAEPVLATFATAYDEDSADAVPGFVERQNLSRNTLLSSRAWVATFDDWNAALRKYGAAEGIPVIDMDARFTGQAELFRDLWHFTNEGHAQAAAFLADELGARFEGLAQ